MTNLTMDRKTLELGDHVKDGNGNVYRVASLLGSYFGVTKLSTGETRQVSLATLQETCVYSFPEKQTIHLLDRAYISEPKHANTLERKIGADGKVTIDKRKMEVFFRHGKLCVDLDAPAV